MLSLCSSTSLPVSLAASLLAVSSPRSPRSPRSLRRHASLRVTEATRRAVRTAVSRMPKPSSRCRKRPRSPKIVACSCASKCGRSGILARMASLSCGRDASHSATVRVTSLWYKERSSASMARPSLENSCTRCGIWDKCAWTSSATAHAREKSRKSRSTATTCWKPGTSDCSSAIMSSNLFSSQRSGLSLKAFGSWQGQHGKTSPVTVSRRPASHVSNAREPAAGSGPKPPQMLLCWLTQKAQIQ
mmetsp:Transcript_32126/g.102168  ORF Transcript_32126/g.102168 Transcript_32126/m.102168 type:complete len:245 (-) Transcript_32126:1503-2237(-)